MALSLVTSATATSTSIASSMTHAIGDLMIIYASSLTTTPPTLPAGWTLLSTSIGATTSLVVGYKYATSTSDGSGTWTGASALNCIIYRNAKLFNDSATATNTNASINYPAKTFSSGPALNCKLLFFAQKNISTIPGTVSGATSRSTLSSASISTKISDATNVTGHGGKVTTEAASSEWINFCLILQPTEGYRYWVGGTGNWNSTDTSHWSTESDGAPGSTCPTSINGTIFDEYSGGGTVSITSNIDVYSIDIDYFESGTLVNTTYTINTGIFQAAGNKPDITINFGSGVWNIIGNDEGYWLVLFYLFESLNYAQTIIPGTATVNIQGSTILGFSYIYYAVDNISSRIYNFKLSGNDYYNINDGYPSLIPSFNNLDLSDFTGTYESDPSYGPSLWPPYSKFNVSGNISMGSGSSFRGSITLDGESPNVQTIDLGSAIPYLLHLNGTADVELAGDIVINDASQESPYIKFTSGNFNSNGYTITTGGITIDGSTTKALDFENSQFVLTNAHGWVDTSTNATCTFTGSTIKFTDNTSATIVFNGKSRTFGHIWLSRGTGTGKFSITGSNIFLSLKDTGTRAHTLEFASGSNNSFYDFIAQGSSGKYLTITSNDTSTHTLTKLGGGYISSRYLDISHSIALPELTWYAETTSIDNQSIATAGYGWIFDYIPASANPAQKKYYEVKVYRPSGEYLTTWSEIISEISFANEINSPGGQMNVTLARNAGDYGEGSDIDFGNIIKIYVYDYESSNGILIFQGKISTYTPIYKDNNIQIIILSYGENMNTTMLQKWVSNTGSLLKPGSGVTVTGLQAPSYTSYGSIYGDVDTPGSQLIGARITIPPGMTTIGEVNFAITPKPMLSYGAPTSGYVLTKDIIMTIYPTLTSGARSGLPDYDAPLGSTTLFSGSTYTSVVTTNVNQLGNEPTPKFYTFTLPELIPVTVGTEYYIVFNSPGGTLDEYQVNWFYTSQSAYIASYQRDISYPYEFFDEVTEFPIEVYNGDGSTKISYLSEDPSDILKDIVLKYNQQGGDLSYSGSSIDTTGTVVSYEFNTNTILEAINKIIELCPVNWYWYVDYETNYIHLHELNKEPDHIFSLEKDLIDAKFEKRVEDVINTIYFTGGETSPGVNFFKKYQIAGSVSRYGIRAMKYSDQRVTVDSTAQTIANSILENKSEPELRITLEVLDSNNNQGIGYDIESIKVGDVVAVRNVSQQVGLSSWDTGRFDEAYWDYNIHNLSSLQVQVQRIDYNENSVRLQASTMAVDVNKRIEDINRNLEAIQNANNPNTPT